MNSPVLEKKSHRRLLITTFCVVIGMFGFGYALVPLYNAFCKITGLNGKTGGRVVYQETKDSVDMKRWVTVEFVTSTNENLPWQFRAETPRVRVHPGKIQKVLFYAKNNTGKTMTIQAIPSVSPGRAAKYLKKTECFCFTQQTFTAGQALDMPVLFHLDKDLPKDIKTITLSYTLFNRSQQQS